MGKTHLTDWFMTIGVKFAANCPTQHKVWVLLLWQQCLKWGGRPPSTGEIAGKTFLSICGAAAAENIQTAFKTHQIYMNNSLRSSVAVIFDVIKVH